MLAADRIAPGDDEAVAAVLDRLVATLDLAVERLAQGDDERGAAALRTIPLARLFRLGVSLCGKVKQLAVTLRREGPFGAQGFDLAETDDAAVLEAVSRLRPMFPRLLDDPPSAGERPFRRLVDLARAAAAIEQAAAAQAMVRALGVTPEDVAPGGAGAGGTGVDAAGLDLGTLARTALVARLLDGGETKRAAQPARFRPLAPEEVKAFEAMIEGATRQGQGAQVALRAREERPRDPDRRRAPAAGRGRGERRRALACHPCTARASAGERPAEAAPEVVPQAVRRARHRRPAPPCGVDGGGSGAQNRPETATGFIA